MEVGKIMDKVYIVTSGAYSDYAIEAALKAARDNRAKYLALKEGLV
jgi:hypothetical protein